MSLRNIPFSFDAATVSQIDDRLSAIEASHGVSIPVAIESGSRAWGFASPDSDYDCRFVFVRPVDHLLSPWPRCDVIETPLEDDLDVNGWELGKALKLLLEGNAVIIEWLRSPIVYRGVAWFRDGFLSFARRFANRDLIGRHYLHLGERQRRVYFGDGKSVAQKKIFYALRPAAEALSNVREAPMRWRAAVRVFRVRLQIRWDRETRMKRRLFATAVGLCLLAPFSLTQAASASAGSGIAAAVASPDRPAPDVARDALRKPAALLAFSGIKAGDRVADLMPGEGYFTRLFSKVVGPRGRVYAIVPTELAQAMPKAVGWAKAVAANKAFANVSVLVVPTASVKAPQPLDLAWTSDNYHDLYAFFGPDKAQAFDKAVYAALKPGGVFIVIDHVGAPGVPPGLPPAVTLDLWMKHLHRIDPAIVKAQVLAAGFRLEAESKILANPADGHDQPIFLPAIKGRTDQFVFRFRKPG